MSGAVGAMSGPLHGGAPSRVLHMIEQVEKTGDARAYVKKLLDDGERLMGFGHRVYKNHDPRATLMRETCHEVLNELGLQEDPLFKLAMELERIALSDDYFISRKLYPNVDFYSGIVQRALGIPTDLFTGIFALARTVGWIAQWKEMRENKEPIGRPRQVYVGATERDYVFINKR